MKKNDYFDYMNFLYFDFLTSDGLERTILFNNFCAINHTFFLLGVISKKTYNHFLLLISQWY